MVDPLKILEEEKTYLQNNEPTFNQSDATGRVFTGKVGRLQSGEDIQVQITFPDFYPIEKPIIKVLTDMEHPNVNTNSSLDLAILDYWEPDFRIKNVLGDVRRLFIRSKKVIKIKPQKSVEPVSVNPQTIQLVGEIETLQRQITELDKQIQEKKITVMNKQGVSVQSAIKVSLKDELDCEFHALNDLLELLDYKFEDAEIDQTDYFRLYKHYTKEHYKLSEQLKSLNSEKQENEEYVVSNKKEKRLIRS